ncbi:MAG TPA: neutral/alkaline non-lysosomal ceramidase N-terminal domain-containing protein [Candidatus Acidoferrales bacterium]|jgi:neutral ceramidase|nr:neutral/alkaline non-lysosomal ceramidase N-terminal domain-containing protein [Candidatus Acidoferrales bacterium]
MTLSLLGAHTRGWRAVALALLGCAATASGATVRAGAGRVDITPSGPIWMSGYATRNHPSESVGQHLWARALAIDTGSRGRLVIVSTDLIGLPFEVSDQVAARARQQFGIERSHLWLNSSHTHTGPVIWPNLASMFVLPPGEEQKLKDYAALLVDNLVAAIGKAVAELAPAEVSFAFGQAGFAMNRREATPTGVKIGVNRQGPGDHEVPVLKVAGQDGKVRAILFAYACHNTTLTGEFYQITGDYAGFAEAELESSYPGSTALFVELCGGDQNPYPRSTLELAVQHGHEMAAEVGRVMKGKMQPLLGRLRTAYQIASLPFAPQERATYEADLQNPKASPAAKQRAQRMLQAIDSGHPVRETPYPVQAIRFGSALTVLALAGEVVVDYDLRAKREYQREHQPEHQRGHQREHQRDHAGEPLIVAGYSNAVMSYIPSERVLREGGYEAVDSMVYYGQPGPFAPGVEERVFSAVHAVMKQVGR